VPSQFPAPFLRILIEQCRYGYQVTTEAPNQLAAEDDALMQAYAAGRNSAFDVLYERYRQPLYQFILHACANPTTAAEVFQDTWMAVIKARSNYQAQGSFKAWLYRIARNKLKDLYRRQSKRQDEQYNEQVIHDTVTTLNAPLNPMELAELNNDRENIQVAVNALPWKQREAVMLKYIAGFTLNEIAQEQGDPTETVKSRLRYAYTRLRQQLRAKL